MMFYDYYFIVLGSVTEENLNQVKNTIDGVSA